MAVTVAAAYVVSIPNAPDMFVKASDVKTIGGHKFFTAHKQNKALLEWVSGHKSWSNAVSTVVNEVSDIRNKVAERKVNADPLPVTATCYKLKRQKRRVQSLVESRSNETIDIELPAFQHDGATIGPYHVKSTMQCAGSLQLGLEPDTLHWFWHRCQVAVPTYKRSVPNSAQQAPAHGVYWHRQKAGVCRHEAAGQR